ncbi:hypothetical protein [Kribbella sp. NPDC051770]|uniref:hypothetical protein n=1 Tax=Kribbella sp. NPDC051770 TaxID=3155413 RepID=UPI00342056D2
MPTPDGHHVVINGRKWRATDPAIPDDVRDRLQHALMAARRAIAQAHRDDDPEAERRARSRVQTAKVALGERGTPWWEQTAQEREDRWSSGLRQLDD